MPLDLTLDLADSSTAADWVKKNRLQSQQRAQSSSNRVDNGQKNELTSSGTGSQDYSSKDLKGMEIMHDSVAFEVGEEVVLTLADTDVVRRDEYGRVISVNDSNDALENVNIAEGERKEDRDKRLKRLRQPIYRGYDDDQFEDDGFGKQSSLLPQYDQEKKRGAKLVIGDGAVHSTNVSSAKLLAEKKAVFQNLNTEYKVGNDFADQSEIKFKKSKKIDEKKRKRIREKSPERDTAQEGAKDEDYDLSKILGDGDEGISATAAEDRESSEKKVENVVNNNQINGNEFEKKPLLSSLLNKRRKINFFSSQFTNISSQSVVYDDEDPDLALAMTRARQSAISARQKDPTAMDEDEGEDGNNYVKETNLDEEDRGAKLARDIALKATKVGVIAKHDAGRAESKEEDRGSTEGIFGEDINVEGRRADGKLVFNSTTEFASRLQAQMTDRARLASEAAVRDMERNLTSAATANVTVAPASENASVASSRAPAASAAAATEKTSVTSATHKHQRAEADWEKLQNEEDDEDNNTESVSQAQQNDEEFLMDIDGEEDDEDSDDDGDTEDLDDEQLAFLHKQPLFAKGLGSTLALLKESGDLKKPNLQAGRARDVRDNDANENPSGIRLDYRDEYGNKLTKKEEFRRLSYHFHGQGPGKKKLEKRLKAQKALMRAGLPKSGVLDGTAGTMKSLHRTLEATGRSHVMLQGGVAADSETINELAKELMKKKEKIKNKKEKKDGNTTSNSSSKK